MKFAGRIAAGVVTHSKFAIVAMVLLTLAVGAGAPQVEQASSLDQFQTDSDVSAKLDYIRTNFSSGDRNTTTAQIIVRGDGTNVLSRESLLRIMEFEQALRANGSINDTLTSGDPVVGIADVIATTALIEETAGELQTRAETLQQRRTALEADQRDFRDRRANINDTAAALRRALDYLRQNPNENITSTFEAVRGNTTIDLSDVQQETFREAAEAIRAAESSEELEHAYQLGTRGVLREEYTSLQERADQLEERATDLQELAATVQQLQSDLQNASTPSHAEKLDQLESMNDSAVERIIERVLSEDGGGDQRVFAFMPTGYQPRSPTASATMLVATQRTDQGTAVQGASSQRIVDSQLTMREIGQERATGLSYLVFGGGVITHEIDTSMSDSLAIVGPLALLFVLVALAIAYRDPFDIVVGVVGIGLVLVWTFGFMGWADIAFNQLFVAVPVLLIGLSIDYAIHIFMRHREERTTEGGRSGSAMRVALAGVGIALLWVTATTVIGFLSNLTSPVPPIREFGVVSAVGIVSALLVFGVLVPAVKVELDDVLERVGLDRRAEAFGTGGGRFSSVLGVGADLARTAPYVVLFVTLVVTAGGAYGGMQVDTSFAQEDFLAEQPPEWMTELPEPFKPGEYTAKNDLDYVNDNFVREDAKAQILVEGNVTDAETLQRIATAGTLAGEKNVTHRLSNGEPAITGPIRTMRRVARENESFNVTLENSDRDGDRIPDQDIARVYDALFAVAPEQAQSVIHRSQGGEYLALRLVISVKGGAAGEAITTQMDDVADSLDGDGLDATATGRAILNEVVQNQLLETVIESLLITLIAIFLFLTVAYRITHGSGTLGIVTLVPVALTVAWILGTMYALGIPFNVLTGTITSLTVGLGVAYGIHISERYNQELSRHESSWDAMHTTVTGTGGALLGSAATTVGGFGVLVFAILPPLQQFGLITGITIIYAFLASVLVLPSLLALWTRYVDPDGSGREIPAADVDGSISGDGTGSSDHGAGTEDGEEGT